MAPACPGWGCQAYHAQTQRPSHQPAAREGLAAFPSPTAFAGPELGVLWDLQLLFLPPSTTLGGSGCAPGPVSPAEGAPGIRHVSTGQPGALT